MQTRYKQVADNYTQTMIINKYDPNSENTSNLNRPSREGGRTIKYHNIAD